MARQPSGTVTFLFTDIEGSTRLLAELGQERYSEALDAHRRLLRAAFERHDGYEVDCEGDAFFIAFQRASEALAAAAEAQASLAAQAWPDGHELRIRIGLHTGEPLLAAPKYVGLDVHKAARLMAAGHGGQVLISQSTRDLVGNEFELRDLGEHRLKDLSASQRLYQLGDADFPPLKTLYRTNLPTPATPLIGRKRELSEVAALLASEHVRMLTLTGPGGTGKTRLALQAAASVADDFPDGVFWVPLAALRDPALVLEAAAHALGTKEPLVKHIADRRVLVVLDNFEHLVAASVDVAAVLATCPRLRVLVTSRERLQLSGEREWPVPPLERSDAVELFTQRARALGVDADRNGAVAELCARLDDLPLALELAAARTKLYSPERLLQRLGQRLDLLKAGARDADPRQQTLRATIEWSYDLLTLDEQTLFARLAVFVGGCTLEAAEEVCDADPDTLASLLDKSLLRRRGDRFLMLETIREYAAERLAEAGQLGAVQHRQAQFVLALGEAAKSGLASSEVARWMTVLEQEQSNLRAALAYFREANRRDEELRLLLATEAYWYMRGSSREGLTWIEALLTKMPDERTSQRGEALTLAAVFANAVNDYDEATTYGLEAVEILRELGENKRLSRALIDLAFIAADRGDESRAIELVEEAICAGRAAGDRASIAIGKCNLGDLAMRGGDYTRAIEVTEEALTVFRDLGRDDLIAWALQNLGVCLLHTDQLLDAATRTAEALSFAHRVGSVVTIGNVLALTARLAAQGGDADTGATLIGAHEALLGKVDAALTGVEADLQRESAQELRRAMGQDRYDTAIARGHAFELEEAVALAAQVLSDE
jgi:predicted ATPase/class 3 adenylate cyclase